MLTKLWRSALGLALGAGVLVSAVAVKAAPADRAVLTGSIRPFSDRVRVAGTAEAGAFVQFDVALKLRNYDALRARLARREKLSPSQLDREHLPLRSDQASLVSWLRENGLTVTRTYTNRLSLQVRGTVAQVEQALGVDLVRVTFEGKA